MALVHFITSFSERLLDITINNDLIWNTHLKMLSKNVIHFFTYCLELIELKYVCLFKTESGFIVLTFFPILICVVL